METTAKDLVPGSPRGAEPEIEGISKRIREYPIKDPSFCKTRISERLWELFQLCDNGAEMGMGITPSGCGKTKAAEEYVRKTGRAILITADVTNRTIGSCLYLIEKAVGFTVLGRSNTARLHRLVDHLNRKQPFLIIDEAHFLPWEAFEMVRKLHDCAGIGVVYLGMPILHTQMRGGNRSYLYDQIFSRIGLRVSCDHVDRGDVSLIVSSMCPDLDKKSLDFLFRKARGAGKYRGMVKLLRRALQIHNTEGIPLGVGLFKEANALLTMGE